MTTTTTTEAPEFFTDEQVETLAETMTEAKPGVGRDALGRFCRRMWAGSVTEWFTAADVSHSNPNCGTLAKAYKAGADVTVEHEASGWLCSGCVAVPRSAFLASLNTAPSHGTAECDTCHNTRKLTSFPTVVHFGACRDRGTTCRKCEASARGHLPRFSDTH